MPDHVVIGETNVFRVDAWILVILWSLVLGIWSFPKIPLPIP
jgi:hypothetical protein